MKEDCIMTCKVHVTNGILDQDEIKAYLDRARDLHGREPSRMDIAVDCEYVDINYVFDAQPFERIRRITGYLVGTLDRFNNSKRAEEQDRVKHQLT
jgi:hypothetical protein